MARAASKNEVQAAAEQSQKETPAVTAIVCVRGQKKEKKKDEPKVFHPYSLTEVTLTDTASAPVSGRAVYAVVEESNHQVTLLYPWTLAKFTVPAYDFIKGQGLTYWPPEKRDAPEFEKFDVDRLAKRMIFLMEDYSRNNKQYSSLTVRSLIAAIQGVPLEQVPLYKSPSVAARTSGTPGERKAPAGPRTERNPRKPGVIDTIKETIKGGATQEEILAALVAKFPDRRPESMTTTIKCQVRRDLLKKGLVIERKQVKGRGEVYTWTNP